MGWACGGCCPSINTARPSGKWGSLSAAIREGDLWDRKPLKIGELQVLATNLHVGETRQEDVMRQLARAAVLGMMLAHGVAHAQDVWPSRNVTFIVPYAAGGYTDLIGRITARYVESALVRTIIVDNRAGAGGIVGTQAVVNAPPDGYTFCVCSIGAISIAPFVQKVGYDPVRDLAPIGIVSSIAQVIITNKNLPVKTLPEFMAYAKAHPGKLNYGSSGAGGLTHYAVELFLARTGTTAVHIPFKGGAQSTAAVISGDVDFAFANMTDALPQIEADLVRGLAVTSRERSAYLRDLPTVHETVAPNFIVETWNGIIAPPGTPEPIVRAMSAILLKMADDPGVRASMRKAGADTVKNTPDEYRAQILREIVQWKPLIGEIADKK
jgi:tripartite-type tricarboxylate transporter receptor subunit TctC